MLWAFGIGVAWLVSHFAVATVDGDGAVSAVADTAGAAAVDLAAAGTQVSGGGAPLWTTGIVLVILTILLVVTVRWVRGHLLDQ